MCIKQNELVHGEFRLLPKQHIHMQVSRKRLLHSPSSKHSFVTIYYTIYYTYVE